MFGWINPEEYSFNHFLLLEEFQIRLALENRGWKKDKEKWNKDMGIALVANPVAAWYFKNRAPKIAHIVDELIANAPAVSKEEVRDAEVALLLAHEDFVIHTTPEKMASS